jgi:ribosomal protein S18 acetylase RimI-like enzyme
MTIPSAKVEIREFRPEDQVAAKQLVLAGMKERWGTIDPTKNPDLENISSTYAEGTFFTAWQNGKLVGTGAIVQESAVVARIVRMSVAAHLRRRGIGREILQHLTDSARSSGYRKVVAETTSTWTDAIAFYRSCGFRVVGSWDGDTHFVLDLWQAEKATTLV